MRAPIAAAGCGTIPGRMYAEEKGAGRRDSLCLPAPYINTPTVRFPGADGGRGWHWPGALDACSVPISKRTLSLFFFFYLSLLFPGISPVLLQVSYQDPLPCRTKLGGQIRKPKEQSRSNHRNCRGCQFPLCFINHSFWLCVYS